MMPLPTSERFHFSGIHPEETIRHPIRSEPIRTVSNLLRNYLNVSNKTVYKSIEHLGMPAIVSGGTGCLNKTT